MYFCIGIVVVFIIVCAFIAGYPFTCSICSTAIKKKSYRVKDDDKKILHLCPKCNTKFEKRQSDRKFKEKYGK